MSNSMTRLVVEKDSVYAIDLSCVQKKRKNRQDRLKTLRGRKRNIRK